MGKLRQKSRIYSFSRREINSVHDGAESLVSTGHFDAKQAYEIAELEMAERHQNRELYATTEILEK
jgi:hypothetical protein